jgi:signal transduction histidine kinase
MRPWELAAAVAQRLPRHHDRRVVALAGCAVAGLAAVATSAAIAASSAASQAGLVALARALIVGVPIAVGLYTWSRRSDERFGLLLVGVGAGLFLTTLAESGDELAYTVGRTAGWLVEVLLVYVILSFPTGRLPERTDRFLVGAMGLVVLTIFLPRLALAEHFEVPSPYTSCAQDCPPNAFSLLEREPAFVDAVMRPVGTLLVFAVMAAVLLRLRQRIRDATPLARRMFTPVLAIGLARVGVLGVAFVARQVDPSAWPVEAAAWLIALAAPAIALAFLVGLLRWRLFAGKALERLAECLRGVPDAPRLRLAFAEAFGDRTIQIAFPTGGASEGWMDSSGHPLTMPGPASGRCVSEVRDGGTVVAAVVHDAALQADPLLLDAGISMAGVVLDNQRLTAQAEAALREVRRSRARIAAGAERERRRIERDLHDGAQQRLVALRIELELAEDLVRRDPEQGVRRLQELERELDETLEELRSLSHGVYPPLLADRGLAEALRAAATRSRLRVELEAHDVERYPPEVESAVYFCVLEALQNALKHAAGARRVVVRLDGGTHAELRFSVRDDGAGTRDGTVRAGAGITNMRDRLAAVGGEVSITSTPGVGTIVRGQVPTPPQAAV